MHKFKSNPDEESAIYVVHDNDMVNLLYYLITTKIIFEYLFSYYNLKFVSFTVEW